VSAPLIRRLLFPCAFRCPFILDEFHTHSWQHPQPNSGQCCVDPQQQATKLRAAPYSATLLGYAAGAQPNAGELTQLTGDAQNVFTDNNFIQIAGRISGQT
jgi:hypothetical protein